MGLGPCDLVSFEFLVKGVSADAQMPGRLFLVPMAPFEGFPQEFFFFLCNGLQTEGFFR
jgi:hypothetical protein